MQSIYEFSWQAEAEVELRRLAEEPDTEATEASLSQVTHDKLCSVCCSFVVWDPKVFIYWSLDHSPPHSGAFDQNVCAP